MLSPNQTYSPGGGRRKSLARNSRGRRYSAVIGQITLTVTDEPEDHISPSHLAPINHKTANSNSMISLPRIADSGQDMYLFDGYEDYTLNERHIKEKPQKHSSTSSSTTSTKTSIQKSKTNPTIQSSSNQLPSMYLSPKKQVSPKNSSSSTKNTIITFHPSVSNQPSSSSSLQVPSSGMGQRRNTMPSLFTEDDDNISIISDSSSICSKATSSCVTPTPKRRSSIIDDIIRSQNSKLYRQDC